MRWGNTLRRLLGGGPVASRERERPAVSPAGDALIAAIEAKLGYRFVDRAHLQKALVHRSHIHVTGSNRREANERLEFLGDAVLGLVVNEYLYRRFPNREEGDLTKMKSLLVCGTRLCEMAGRLDLGRHIMMSRSEAATGGRQPLEHPRRHHGGGHRGRVSRRRHRRRRCGDRPLAARPAPAT